MKRCLLCCAVLASAATLIVAGCDQSRPKPVEGNVLKDKAAPAVPAAQAESPAGVEVQQTQAEPAKAEPKPSAPPPADKPAAPPVVAEPKKPQEQKPAQEVKKPVEPPRPQAEAKKPAEAAPKAAEQNPADNDAAKPLKKAQALVQLPFYINTSDGMALMKDNSVLVTAPNINNEAEAPWILKLTTDNKIEKFFDPPRHPDTGKAYPFGICVDPASGDVYYADLQWFAEKEANWKSRVMHIDMQDGKPQKATVLASGTVVCNAVIIRDGYLYTTDTSMLPDSKPLISGIFRFKLGEEGVQVKQPLDKDPHCIATIVSHNEKIGFGADGLTFDSQGNLYVGNFADGTLHKIEFDDKGNVKTPSPAPVWAKAPFMKSCDGILYCPKGDKIFVADSQANAVQMVSMDGKVQCLAQELTDDGKDGKLDQPCEVVLRGNEMIIGNFDMPVEGGVNKKFEVPNYLSVIKME